MAMQITNRYSSSFAGQGEMSGGGTRCSPFQTDQFLEWPIAMPSTHAPRAPLGLRLDWYPSPPRWWGGMGTRSLLRGSATKHLVGHRLREVVAPFYFGGYGGLVDDE